MRNNPTHEEKYAKEILEKYVYLKTHFSNADQPDIQSQNPSIGIEHCLITTPTSQMQEKMSDYIEQNEMNLSEASEYQDHRFHQSKFLICANDNGKVLGLFSFPQYSFIQMLENVLTKKYADLNSQKYHSFSRYELFLTLHRDWMSSSDYPQSLKLIKEFNSKYHLNFKRIYILKTSSLVLFENDSYKEIEIKE